MIRSAKSEALEICGRLMPLLIAFSSSDVLEGALLRAKVGKFLSNFSIMYDNKTIGAELLACFDQARIAGTTLMSLNDVRNAMFAEAPVFDLGVGIVNAAIIFSFVEQSQIISVTEFASRGEVDSLMEAMSEIIEQIKLNKADSFSSRDYQNFVQLAALLIQHLSAIDRQLPRIVPYSFPVNYPALAMSNRIYGDGTRSEELIAENKTVHPAFMQRDIIALSA